MTRRPTLTAPDAVTGMYLAALLALVLKAGGHVVVPADELPPRMMHLLGRQLDDGGIELMTEEAHKRRSLQ